MIVPTDQKVGGGRVPPSTPSICADYSQSVSIISAVTNPPESFVHSDCRRINVATHAGKFSSDIER